MTTETKTETVQLTRLEELEVSVAQSMASDFTEIGQLFATNPAEAALKQQQLFGKVKADAMATYDTEVKAAKDTRDALQAELDIFKGQMSSDFGKVWEPMVTNALTFPFIERWIVQWDLVKDDSGKPTGYKPATIIAVEPKQIKAGVKRDTPSNGTGSRSTTVDGVAYSSAADALRKLHPDITIKPGLNAVRELQKHKHNVEITSTT